MTSVANGGEDAAPPLDPRARRSKAALEAAVLELVAVQDLAQISVSDITKHAGVSRSTFYEHYTDVHDLAAAACTEMFDDMVSHMALGDPRVLSFEDPEDNPIVPLFRHFARYAHLYRSLLGPDGSARVINHLLDHLRNRTMVNLEMALDVAAVAPPGRTPVSDGTTAAIISGALLSLAVDWLMRGRPETPEALAARAWPRLLAAGTTGSLADLALVQPSEG